MRGCTVWFTGVPGSGKTALARAVEGELLERGMKVEVLDEKEIPSSGSDPAASLLWMSLCCQLLTRNDVVAIGAFISPCRKTRDEARKLIGRFVEVYCRKSGEASVSYEVPDKPEVVCDTDKETVAQGASKILKTLEILGFVPVSEAEEDYSEEDEDKIRQRLQDLGYI